MTSRVAQTEPEVSALALMMSPGELKRFRRWASMELWRPPVKGLTGDPCRRTTTGHRPDRRRKHASGSGDPRLRGA